MSSGFFLGRNEKNQNLYANSYDPILLLAPHQYGKGVCIFIPNLLNLDESSIVHDIKSENYALTAKHRKESMGHEIFLFDPLNKKTNCYNPLDFISENQDEMIFDLENIIDLLISDDKSDFDLTEVKNLFISLGIILKTNKTQRATIGEILRILYNQNFLSQINEKSKNINDFAMQNIESFLKKDKESQDLIVCKLRSFLDLWKDPAIDFATSRSDFNFSEMKLKKMTIYIGVSPLNSSELKPLFNVIYNHAAQKLIKQSEKFNNSYDEKNNQAVCFFLDDFFLLGKMNLISSYLPHLKGYKIRLFLSASSLSDIESVYSESETENILSVCSFKIIFKQNNFRTAEKISKFLINVSERKEFLSPLEIMSLDHNSQIVLMGQNQDPIICAKYFYYNDEKESQKVKDFF